ncbi:HAMP domain-containing sensor histidine kinase [Paenibacillus sp. J2TS4]|uniref:HAMP domain-containing sensor histidine kinase n=1 Tax=Paenibacillus sp. J2TS4 TaxID=2807194 RepID=UPI001B23D6B8|nr:HAMP domain-containing sensor histidine kinase [Paenibacillus sp. J2TS4]GIP36170.1 hypothetical protein J2TS4_53800 [Paenibacillus sp. J2TS4]
MKARKIYPTLMWNYFMIILITSLVVIISFIYIGYSIYQSIKASTLPLVNAEDLVQSDYQNLSIGELVELGAWVEIVNAEYELVYVIGEKQDSYERYTTAELLLLLSYSPERDVYTSAVSFVADDGEPYSMLLKIPKEAVSGSIDLMRNSDQTFGEVAVHLLLSFLAIPVLLLLIVFIYTFWTAKRISRPLQTIAKGLSRMVRGDYGTRIQLKAVPKSEIGQIRDAFNVLSDRLEASERETKRLEESKQRMLIDLSHDLKTPMTTIQGYAKTLSDPIEIDDEKKKRYLKIIYNKSVRMTALIDSMFDLLKLDAPDFHLSLQRKDFTDFMREMVAEHYEQMDEKRLDVHIDLPQESIMLDFDQRHMSRVVVNLFTNAVKYNDPGTMLRICLRQESSAAVLEIADRGKGIPDKLKATLFDPFVRGDEARSSIGGTGLGLAIAHKIIQKHGGQLSLASNDQEKTIFVIRLPLS